MRAASCTQLAGECSVAPAGYISVKIARKAIMQKSEKGTMTKYELWSMLLVPLIYVQLTSAHPFEQLFFLPLPSWLGLTIVLLIATSPWWLPALLFVWLLNSFLKDLDQL